MEPTFYLRRSRVQHHERSEEHYALGAKVIGYRLPIALPSSTTERLRLKAAALASGKEKKENDPYQYGDTQNASVFWLLEAFAPDLITQIRDSVC